ncbi:hypothetical protein B0T10DRAFT_484302 [Thelonectria olida]|uniref:Uncharacterized protein n=1 Tax=Thelonectria olida TaxID=1576542 RepID=A0A9P8W8R9_9HYPO|nr:hypothetical protein B0T10DRAFT_484302 [Thelonectria olida]
MPAVISTLRDGIPKLIGELLKRASWHRISLAMSGLYFGSAILYWYSWRRGIFRTLQNRVEWQQGFNTTGRLEPLVAYQRMERRLMYTVGVTGVLGVALSVGSRMESDPINIVLSVLAPVPLIIGSAVTKAGGDRDSPRPDNPLRRWDNVPIEVIESITAEDHLSEGLSWCPDDGSQFLPTTQQTDRFRTLLERRLRTRRRRLSASARRKAEQNGDEPVRWRALDWVGRRHAVDLSRYLPTEMHGEHGIPQDEIIPLIESIYAKMAGPCPTEERAELGKYEDEAISPFQHTHIDFFEPYSTEEHANHQREPIEWRPIDWAGVEQYDPPPRYAAMEELEKLRRNMDKKQEQELLAAYEAETDVF